MLQLIKPKIIPNLVAESVVNLILERNKLTSLEIDEWSIHQGGKKVLPQFSRPEILGLTSENLQPSLELFNLFIRYKIGFRWVLPTQPKLQKNLLITY